MRCCYSELGPFFALALACLYPSTLQSCGQRIQGAFNSRSLLTGRLFVATKRQYLHYRDSWLNLFTLCMLAGYCLPTVVQEYTCGSCKDYLLRASYKVQRKAQVPSSNSARWRTFCFTKSFRVDGSTRGYTGVERSFPIYAPDRAHSKNSSN